MENCPNNGEFPMIKSAEHNLQLKIEAGQLEAVLKRQKSGMVFSKDRSKLSLVHKIYTLTCSNFLHQADQ